MQDAGITGAIAGPNTSMRTQATDDLTAALAGAADDEWATRSAVPAAAGGMRRREGRLPPLWFDLLIVVAVSGVLSFGTVGLLLADFGAYSIAPAFILGAIGTAAAAWLGRPRSRERRRGARRNGTGAALGMCFVVVVDAVWNSLHTSYHILADRDPGLYLLAGKWIAGHGNLVVTGGATWTAKGSFFQWWVQGMYPSADGSTALFQFNHFLPSLLAEADNIGGDRLMFRVPAVLGGISLCVMYAVGCRLIRRPWLVLAAVTGYSLSLPQLYVSRDTFSEIATEVLLWGGILFLLRAYATRRWVLGALAGLCLGGTVMTHVDAVIYLVPLPLLAAISWLAAGRAGDRQGLPALYSAVAVGAIPLAALGTFDIQRRSTPYYNALSPKVHELYAAVGGSVLLAVVLISAWSHLPQVREWLLGRRHGLAAGAALFVGVVLAAAWVLRPLGPKGRLSQTYSLLVTLQTRFGLPLDGNRSYAEQTMRWLEWYVGPVALMLGIAGMCILVGRGIRDGSGVATIVLLELGGVSALYLWNPNILPDQLWATRRFVTAAFPLLMIGAGLAIDELTTRMARLGHNPVWPLGVAAVSGVALVVFPLSTTLPVVNFRAGSDFLPAVQQACSRIGANGAILFLRPASGGSQLVEAVRSWCDVPVASLREKLTPSQLAAVAEAFRHDGRVLWLADSTPQTIVATSPRLKPILLGVGVDKDNLSLTLDEPPQSYNPSKLSIYGAKAT